MDNVDQVFHTDSRVADNLFLRSQQSITPNLYKTRIEIDGVGCKIFDVGGTRLQHSKTRYRFSDIGSVILVVSLLEYRKLLSDFPQTASEQSMRARV